MPLISNGPSRLIGGGRVPWYRAGGAPLPAAAYQPKGAASLAASYVNLANPGTYNAAPGVAPTFAAATGWTFAGAQWLRTGIQPAAFYSLIARYTVTGSGSMILIGARNGASNTTRLQIGGATSSTRNYAYANAWTRTPNSGFTGGVQAVTAVGGYYNGSLDAAAENVWSGTGLELYIAALNTDGNAGAFLIGNIQAVAIYSATLTAAQVAAVSAAMAAL